MTRFSLALNCVQNPQGEFDDKLAYYGSTIHSRVTVRGDVAISQCASRVSYLPRGTSLRPAIPGGRQCYECVIVFWKCWVEDNYEREGNKQFGAKWLGFVRPTQREMREFGDYGCAQPYQRTSKSWLERPETIPAITICYNDAADLKDWADERRRLDQERAQDQQNAQGALPMAGPAEDRPAD